MTDRATALEALFAAAVALLAETKYVTVAECEAIPAPVCTGNRLRDAVDAVPPQG